MPSRGCCRCLTCVSSARFALQINRGTGAKIARWNTNQLRVIPVAMPVMVIHTGTRTKQRRNRISLTVSEAVDQVRCLGCCRLVARGSKWRIRFFALTLCSCLFSSSALYQGSSPPKKVSVRPWRRTFTDLSHPAHANQPITVAFGDSDGYRCVVRFSRGPADVYSVGVESD